MIRAFSILLAVILTLAVPVAATEQRRDGFGPPGYHRTGPNSDRSCGALGVCRLETYVRRDKQVYEVWTCGAGQYILWPVACDEDPTQPPCKKV